MSSRRTRRQVVRAAHRGSAGRPCNDLRGRPPRHRVPCPQCAARGIPVAGEDRRHRGSER